MELEAINVLGVLLDHYSSQILIGTIDTPKGIRELSKEYKIPLSVCYRRVKMLAEMGLLNEKKYGKRVKYVSNIENFKAVLNFEENKMVVDMDDSNGENYRVEGNIV